MARVIMGILLLANFSIAMNDSPRIIQTINKHQHRMARIMGKSQRGRIDMISGLMFCYSDYGCDREYKNCPLKHLNPKGWVDAYRIPKYMYYLYQANYAEKPMVFIHPHYWQQNYINTHQDIVVDSNCDQVELFIDGKSMGVKYPSWQNFFTVTFRNIPIQGSVLKAVGKKCDTTVLHSLPIPGKPAQLLLESSHDFINANRDSVVVVKADIVDRNGHHIYGANNTLSWKVEGPASCVGPAIYKSDRQDHEKMQGVMYIDAPVSNIVRSNGIAGEIIVTVESPGLAADSIRITAVKSSDGAEKPIIEIPLVTTGRQKTKRDPAFLVTHSKSVSLFNPIDHDIQITGQDVAWQLSKKLQELNPNMDPRSSEFEALHKALLQILESNQGRVVADDYNFLIKTIAQRE